MRVFVDVVGLIAVIASVFLPGMVVLAHKQGRGQLICIITAAVAAVSESIMLMSSLDAARRAEYSYRPELLLVAGLFNIFAVILNCFYLKKNKIIEERKEIVSI